MFNSKNNVPAVLPVLLGLLLLMTGMVPVAGVDACPAAPDGGARTFPPPGDPAPPWAAGCRWSWSANQNVNFTFGFMNITHVSGTIVDELAETTAYNGTQAYRVEGTYSSTLKGSWMYGPISWLVTGNTTDYYRIPDLATAHQVGHFAIDMGMFGKTIIDSTADADPPVQYYKFPLNVHDSWRFGSELTSWTRTSGPMGNYESTTVGTLNCLASVPSKDNLAVPAGIFACDNITYNGTFITGQSVQPYNDTRFYSPVPTNLAIRSFQPMVGLKVMFGLTGYTLNHAPTVISPLPWVKFPEDTVGSLDLARVFSDPDAGDSLHYQAFNTSNITVALDTSNGRVTLASPKDWSGSERIIFGATDSKGASSRAEILVTVMPVNDPPVLSRPLPGIIMNEDTVYSSLNLSEYITDVDIPYGDRLQFLIIDNGSISAILPAGSNVTLRPSENWSGVQNMTVIASDAASAEVRAGLTVVVLNTPDPPVAIYGTREFSIPEDTSLVLDLSKWFWDADLVYGDYLAFLVEGLPSGYDVQLDGRTGALNMTPPKDYNGMLTLAFIATDSTGLRAVEEVRLAILPVNDQPVLLGSFPPVMQLAFPENTTQMFSVVAFDVDSSTLNYTWYLDANETGTGPDFTFLAGFDSAGSHNLTARISDGELETCRTWELKVMNVNRPPVGVRITSPANGTTLQQGKPVTFSAEGSDPDGDNLTFSWKDNGVKFLGSGRSLSVKWLSVGKHTISLEASDGSAPVTAVIEVTVSAQGEARRVPGLDILPLLACIALAVILARQRTR